MQLQAYVVVIIHAYAKTCTLPSSNDFCVYQALTSCILIPTSIERELLNYIA